MIQDSPKNHETSSRSGRFKKKLVSLNDLLLEAPLIESKMAPILKSFESGKLSAAEFTSLYLVTMLSHRFPGDWLGAKRENLGLPHSLNFKLSQLSDLQIEFEPNIRKRLSTVENLGDLFNSFALKSTPETVNRSLLHWSTDRYGLELMFRIPDSLEVLAQQTQGRRCVSVLTKAERCQSYILGERDALSFTMHDLIHADHFFHHPVTHDGQLGFYGLMDLCLRENHFQEQMKHPKFAVELDYLISDMNAYAVHLLKCFKAALFHYHDNGTEFFADWLIKVKANEEEKRAFTELNSPLYSAEARDHYLLDFLKKFRVSGG